MLPLCPYQLHNSSNRILLHTADGGLHCGAASGLCWGACGVLLVAAAAEPATAPSEAITLTENALSHLLKLRQEKAAAAGGKDQQMVFRVSSLGQIFCVWESKLV